MDFIERLLGVAPDGGSGALEVLLVVAPPITFSIWRLMRRHGRRRAPCR